MKIKLFQCITTIISAVIIFSQIPAAVAEMQAPTITTRYDASAKTFLISGQLPNASKGFIAVVLAPQDTAISSAEDLAKADVILKTAQTDSQGNINFKIILPDSANEPRYKYTISVNDITKSSMFSSVADNELLPYLSGVNFGGLSAAKEFVINDATGLDDGKEKNEDFIASYINEVKPEEGYTTATLMNAYMVGEGLSYAEDGNMTIGEFLANYCHYLDKDYIAQYEQLSEKTQLALNNAFKNGSVVKDFDTTYKNNLFVAEYTSANNPTELKRVLLAYIETSELALNEFNKIGNSVYKEKVFDELYKSRSMIKTLPDIIIAFNQEIKEQQKAADKKRNNLSSASDSSYSASGKTGSISANASDAAPLASFSDMANHWSKTYVNEMYERGIVHGFSDGTFKPDSNVTRAEFAKMIAQILGLDTLIDSDFIDVANDSWYKGYVAAVEKAGIVIGADGKFMPEMYITRQDAAVVLARVLTYKGMTYSTGSFGFNDESEVSAYAKNSVNGMAGLGLITGYGESFAPLDNTTRGQAAALIMRVADYIK